MYSYDEDAVRALLGNILQNSSVKDAAREAEALTGWPRRSLYQMALSIARNE
jgi:hypothetical protein